MQIAPRFALPPCVIGDGATFREFFAGFADEFEIVLAFLARGFAEEETCRLRSVLPRIARSSASMSADVSSTVLTLKSSSLPPFS